MKPRAADWRSADGGLAEGAIVVALGGNLGGVHVVEKRCLEAVEALSLEWGPACVSRFFVTAPVGAVQDQPDFLNAVAAWRPPLAMDPETALAALQRQESHHGREREVVGAARTLDLDLLLHGSQVRTGASLELPHPRMHERAFVLQPLLDLFGADFHWGGHPPLAQLLAEPEVAAQAAEPLL